MYVSMDVIEGNTVVGEGLNGTLMGAASPVTEGKIGQAVRLYGSSIQDHIYFGHHPDTCLGNIYLCPSLTIALWLKLEGNGWTAVFKNSGGLRFYIRKFANHIGLGLYCLTQTYSIDVYVPDADPAGWNHYITSCTRTIGTIFVNGKEYVGTIGSTGSATDGRVMLGMGYYHTYRYPFLVDELMVWYIPLNKTCASFVFKSFA